MNKSGFTLVELSIVIVIAGIMLFGATSMIAITTNNARIQSTNDTLQAIERALKLHYRTFGSLPCAAEADTGLSDSSFGTENCPDTEGVVPTRTLKLPDSYMFDGWGNRISYNVDGNCITTPWVDGSCASPAAISVFDNSDTNGDGNNDADDLRTSAVAYVLVSHGKNGLGGYSRNGGTNLAASERFEMENSDFDSVFHDDFIKDWDGVGAVYFDDIVLWRTEAQISYED